MKLPNDIFYEIFEYCSLEDLIKLNLTSKNIFQITCGDKYWKQIYNTKHNKYIFNNSGNWRNKFINRSKTDIVIRKVIKKISDIKIEDICNDLVDSTFYKIKWMNNNKHNILKKPNIKVKTVVRNHKYNNYFISTIYLISDDKLYFSNYFVNTSRCYDILYKIEFEKILV